VERNWRGVNSGGGNQVGVKKNLDGGECQNEGRNSGAGGVVVKDSVTIGERKKRLKCVLQINFEYVDTLVLS